MPNNGRKEPDSGGAKPASSPLPNTGRSHNQNPFNAKSSDANEKLRHQAFNAAYGAAKLSPQGTQQDRINSATSMAQNYVNRRQSFVNSNDLSLHPDYHSERDQAKHPYPRGGQNQPVEYIDHNTNERQKYAIDLKGGKVVQGGIRSTHNDNVDNPAGNEYIYARRGSNDKQILAMKKEKQSDDGAHERTQHSTFNSAMNVSMAGKMKFGSDGKVDSVLMESGHYRPDVQSAIKTRIWANETGAFGKDVPIKGRGKNGGVIDTGMAAQVKAVNEWAQKHPKPNSATQRTPPLKTARPPVKK